MKHGFVGLLLMLFSFSAARASTYYVSPGGNDIGPGGEGMPWKTLQRAANSARAGDTFIIHAGTYSGFVLGWDKSAAGKPGNPINFQADPGATITGRNMRTPDGIDLEPGCGYVTITGFTINNASGNIRRAGIRVCGSDHVVVSGNDCEDNGIWGIFSSKANDLLIENNITARSKTQHGIYVSNSADRPVIRGNKTFGNAQCGIHLNGDASQGGDGLITNALIEDNIIHDNGTVGGSAINGDGLVDSIIRCNLLYNNHASGIALFDEDGAHGSTGNFVLNNTILMAADARWAININRKSTGNTLVNNIILSANPERGSIGITNDSRAGFVSDHNILQERFALDEDTLQNIAAWRSKSGQDADSRPGTAAELFVNPDQGDFHLKPGSVAIGAGATSTAHEQLPHADLAGAVITSTPDAGAFQFTQTK